jgi:hypothetical protein
MCVKINAASMTAMGYGEGAFSLNFWFRLRPSQTPKRLIFSNALVRSCCEYSNCTGPTAVWCVVDGAHTAWAVCLVTNHLDWPWQAGALHRAHHEPEAIASRDPWSACQRSASRMTSQQSRSRVEPRGTRCRIVPKPTLPDGILVRSA